MCGGLISVSRSLKKYNKIMKEQEIKRKKAREQKRKRQLAEQGKQGKAHKKVFGKDKKGQAMRGGMRRVTPRRKLNEVFHSDVHALRAFHIGHKTGPAIPNLGKKVKPG